jgi:hypothetical protein
VAVCSVAIKFAIVTCLTAEPTIALVAIQRMKNEHAGENGSLGVALMNLTVNLLKKPLVHFLFAA